MPCITVKAEISSIPTVTEFVDTQLENLLCPFKAQAKIDIAIDELLSNISHYAYAGGSGDVIVETAFDEKTRKFAISFIDSGVPYNPLEKSDPDVSLSAEEREVGGLGIFMVKNMVDDISYSNNNSKNILTITKII